MDIASPARSCHHTRIRLTTRQVTEFIDLTDRLNGVVAEAAIEVGTLNVQTSHTTTAIIVNEHEPRLLTDFTACLERMVPRAMSYAHDDMSRRVGVPAGEPRNGHAHCRALLLPPSASLNIIHGRLALGEWQRIFLVELDGPRNRVVSVVVMGETSL